LPKKLSFAAAKKGVFKKIAEAYCYFEKASPSPVHATRLKYVWSSRHGIQVRRFTHASWRPTEAKESYPLTALLLCVHKIRTDKKPKANMWGLSIFSLHLSQSVWDGDIIPQRYNSTPVRYEYC
jgi:hypothetical protein